MKAMDYVIVDPVMVKAGEERFFVEKPGIALREILLHAAVSLPGCRAIACFGK